jgi:hypothetical protein
MSARKLLQDECLLKIGHETMKNLLKILVDISQGETFHQQA